MNEVDSKCIFGHDTECSENYYTIVFLSLFINIALKNIKEYK